MIKPPEIICKMLDILQTTLATCEPQNCSTSCFNYLMNLGLQCPMIFQHEEYNEMWKGLIDDCVSQGVQTTFNPFQPINH